MRLIDADALKDLICSHCDVPKINGFATIEECRSCLCSVMDAVDEMPTVDAVPVVHGHWKYVKKHCLTDYYKCSVCGNVTNDYIINKQTFHKDNLYYCPNCGAKMDLEESND